MDNSNFWDWENAGERTVSSVYADEETDAEALEPQNMEAQNAPIQNNKEQAAKERTLEAQTNIEQKTKPHAQTQTNIMQTAETNQADITPQAVAAENNFILVDNPQTAPQNFTPQTELSYVQAEAPCTQTEPSYVQAEAPCTQTEPSYAQVETPYTQAQHQQTNYQQTQHQQTNFQQIIPIQNAQQNQGTKNQNTNRSADYSARFHPNDISANKVSAITAYLLGAIGIIIALLIARDSAYTAFHVRQALKLTICSVILEVFAAIFAVFAMIPFVGIIFKMMLVLAAAALAGIWILRFIAIAQVSSGEAKEPAFIRNFTFLK